MSGSRDEGAGGLHLAQMKKDPLLGPPLRRKTHLSDPDSQTRRPVEGYIGLDRTRAVGVRYGTPLYVHLQGATESTWARPQVEKVTRSTCPRPGKTSYALHPQTTDLSGDGLNKLPAVIIAEENETTNRRWILAADGHLCVHTIGSSGLFGLGHSFHVPQPEVARMRTGKTGAFCLHERGCLAGVIDVGVRTGLHRGPSHSNGLQRMMFFPLIWWLGGL